MNDTGITAMQAAQDIATEKDYSDLSGSRQYLTFVLADEEYGIDILRVQEIKGWDSVTLLPNMPEYMRGVINLRGAIVPIIDLRMRFNLKKLDYGPLTVVIVLRVNCTERERTMGIVVDAVSDVYDICPENTETPPDFGNSIDAEAINGLATVNEKMVILLDIDHLINVGFLECLDDNPDQVIE